MSYSTIALTHVDRDGARARADARPILGGFLAEFGVNTMTDAYGISDQLAALLERHGPDGVAAAMPDEWLEDLTLVGTPAEVAAKMQPLARRRRRLDHDLLPRRGDGAADHRARRRGGHPRDPPMTPP